MTSTARHGAKRDDMGITPALASSAPCDAMTSPLMRLSPSMSEEPFEFQDPFVYFLSSVVDCLEPLTRVALLQRAMPPPPGDMLVER
jgi:hypothetical protein